ncbi:MAG: hypothetical protein JWN44_1594 [Myxococcales bacterium]|nr:hypothetical protein [Myxococcales bacterium]
MRYAYALATAVATAAALPACTGGNPNDRITGQTEFVSSAMAGYSRAGATSGGGGSGGGDAAGAPAANGAGNPAMRTVEETDLYRLDGTTLYYLNGYRGLMVFDVADVDHPKLLGRSPIYGSPVEMIVRNGIAVVVVSDWYGALDDGSPFHGSIVRGLDATNPANITPIGEAKLGGWVRDTRVVGDVLYAVSEDYGWVYGWGGLGDVGVGSGSTGVGTTTQPTASVVVSSVYFGAGAIQSVGYHAFPGYTGIFNVTANSILMAHDTAAQTAQTELLYLDISDPQGAIVQRGAITVEGRANGWGADNGRWNLDFADGKTAHLVGCAGGQYGCNGNGYVLDTVDFSNPNAPVLKSKLDIPSTGWSIAARFDAGRMYLSPENGYYGSNNSGTPFQVYDLADPSAPKLAGTATIPGTVWNILPAPQQRIFALGNDWNGGNSGDSVSLKYLDVTNPSAPKLIGTSTFGQGWAWTPAAGTFKAFTMDATKGLVVLPFSGWSYNSQSYNNGLQLIEFSPTTTRTAGAAKTRGWVERGIFVGTRLVSLSDLALSVVDYANHDAPKVIAELTLARNVIAAHPAGATIAEVSSDWWDHDVSASEVRVLPIGNAEESTDAGNIPSVNVDGVNAQVFRNGDVAYIVTNVSVAAKCSGQACVRRAQQVQVVDLSGGGATLRGKLRLPLDDSGFYGWGWWGCYWYDWYGGAEVVQVGGSVLAFRRFSPIYDASGHSIIDDASALYVVDLSDADAPNLASVTITQELDGWWGNLRVVGGTLYSTHVEWFQKLGDPNAWLTKYYADRIDLSDPRHPKVGSKINTPGLIIGGSEKDPSILYTIDYRWDGTYNKNDFDVVRLHGNKAELLSKTTLDGWVGQTFFQANHAYLSTERYDNSYSTVHTDLHAIDLTNPSSPVDRVSNAKKGWGWLLAVEGDRAVVTSGWGGAGVDIYGLSDDKAPEFRQFARTRGWWANGVSRQDSSLFLSSGYWGVQRIDLQ